MVHGSNFLVLTVKSQAPKPLFSFSVQARS